MKNIPNRIWLQTGGSPEEADCLDFIEGVTWCQDKQREGDTEYLKASVDTSVLERIISKWGRETQINKIQEECLELALVLNQMNCPTKDPKEMEEQLYDELADVKILMAQAEILFDSDRINARIKFKLDKVQRKYLNQ